MNIYFLLAFVFSGGVLFGSALMQFLMTNKIFDDVKEQIRRDEQTKDPSKWKKNVESGKPKHSLFWKWSEYDSMDSDPLVSRKGSQIYSAAPVMFSVTLLSLALLAIVVLKPKNRIRIKRVFWWIMFITLLRSKWCQYAMIVSGEYITNAILLIALANIE